jgi:hypothetical protein
MKKVAFLHRFIRKPPKGAPLDWPLLPPKLRDFLCGMH